MLLDEEEDGHAAYVKMAMSFATYEGQSKEASQP